jgi:hypothetical protein
VLLRFLQQGGHKHFLCLGIFAHVHLALPYSFLKAQIVGNISLKDFFILHIKGFHYFLTFLNVSALHN